MLALSSAGESCDIVLSSGQSVQQVSRMTHDGVIWPANELKIGKPVWCSG